MASGVGIGIDVAKDWLDVASSERAIVQRFANDETGLTGLVERLRGVEIHRIVLEASGGYEVAALLALFAAGHPVVLAQPSRVRHFAKGIGRRAKTDLIDASVLAEMALKGVDDRPLWRPTEDAIADLKALVERRQHLIVLRDAERKRLRLVRPIVRPDLEASITTLTSEIKKLEQRVEHFLEANDALTAEIAVLEQVRGVGRITAATLRALVPELGTLTRTEVAALVGVAPINRDSGKKEGRRYTQGGRATARRSLYMAALAASRWNPIIQSMYARLVARNKEPKVALVACMRKLLIHLNSRMRSYKSGPTQAALQLS